MANHLIPYVEFLGLPGSGKSFYSHKVAEKLREEGYAIAEPSWKLDHTCDKYLRAIKKICMSWLYSVKFPKQANQIKDIISLCGYKGGEHKRMSRNLLYKTYILTQRNTEILLFDEGLAQMAVSLSLGCKRPANQLFFEIEKVLSIQRKRVLIRINCCIEEALKNMEMRDKHDSRVEKLSDINEQINYLERYKVGCEYFKQQSEVFDYSSDGDAVVSEITNYIKKELTV